MKQSEMQVLICKLLEEQSLQGTAYMFKAQQILELIEKEGMLPPSKCDSGKCSKIGCGNEWETEDETK